VIPETLYITPAYWDPAANDRDKAQLQADSLWCYDRALAGDWQEVSRIVRNWALINKGCANREAKLVLTFKGQLFLEAYLLGGGRDHDVFPAWVAKVFRPSAREFYGEGNNQGAWGLLGCILADLVLGNDVQRHAGRFYEYVSAATDGWPALSRSCCTPAPPRWRCPGPTTGPPTCILWPGICLTGRNG
jgi:hypothetical protein